MTTSGTTSWFPSTADLCLEAFDRCQIRPSSLTRSQLVSAYRSVNLELQTWANRGVNLWAVDLQSVPLIQGTQTYNTPSDTVQVLDVYLNYVPNSGNPISRIIYPISRTDYAAIPNKLGQGVPSVFWFDKLSPVQTLTLWYVPDATGQWTMNYYRMRRIQDANLSNGETADIPYRFIEALCAGIAARLAQKFNPQMWAMLKEEAKEQWKEAADEDIEKVTMYLQPSFDGYYS